MEGYTILVGSQEEAEKLSSSIKKGENFSLKGRMVDHTTTVKPITLAVLTPGAYFGHESLLSQTPAQSSVRAAGNVTLVKLPARHFCSLLEEFPQRLVIARALLTDPSILILDEPTAALDLESERIMLENLEQQVAGRTTFMIAHRLSTVKNADRIIVIDQGRIVEMGTHEELRSQQGLYFELNNS